MSKTHRRQLARVRGKVSSSARQGETRQVVYLSFRTMSFALSLSLSLCSAKRLSYTVTAIVKYTPSSETAAFTRRLYQIEGRYIRALCIVLLTFFWRRLKSQDWGQVIVYEDPRLLSFNERYKNLCWIARIYLDTQFCLSRGEWKIDYCANGVNCMKPQGVQLRISYIYGWMNKSH